MTGEMVILQREPNNQYDSNAIQVMNVRGQQIGHIPRTVASNLAPFMDSRRPLVEGETTGPKDYYECPLVLKLYGSNDPIERASLKDDMDSTQLPLDEFNRQERARVKAERERAKMLKAAKKGGMSRPDGQGGQFLLGVRQFAGGSTQTGDGVTNLEDIIKESVRFNPRNVDQMVEQFGLKDDDLANMGKAEQPAMVKTQLLPYQLQVR
jgi:SWI/SNF-related matrix-associated actin-dependent regulator of chromatin subfamily A3